jgi:hypothetical protein
VASCVWAEPAVQERMAAWHHTLTGIDEQTGHAYAATYISDRPAYMEVHALAKFVSGVTRGDGIQWQPESVSVTDAPGSVQATARFGEVTLHLEVVPLMSGRDTAEWDGAALYTVRAEPPVPVTVRCGGGALITKPALDWVRAEAVGAEGDTVELRGTRAEVHSAAQPHPVALASSGVMSVEPGDTGGQRVSLHFVNGEGYVLMSYAHSAEAALKLAGMDAVSARAAQGDYYRRLLDNRIETPEPVLDQAFRSALCTLEYNWIAPYGWNECINHWLALWHMQHTAGAEWIGQADRSRACNLTTAANLYPDGAAPQFYPNGLTHRDFGGSNQFFAWQVAHYARFTGDHDAMGQLAPALDRVIAQTFRQYDPEDDLLLAWGQQIGNQEDYVSTPYNGTSPTIEGINMLRTRAMLARALGDAATAETCEAKAALARDRLRAQLWLPDLGRFAFQQDPHGMKRLDGQYHTFLYPAMWGLLDAVDAWTSLGPMRDRLTGPGGEVYCSNNFPNHVGGTWGMQAGAAQQPWAAWGLASAGLRNEAFQPLRAVARWVMDENHRGAWPEIATEPNAAYFSPPAGLYIQAIAEALFGLEVDRIEGALKVSPAFPDTWPQAKLNLIDYTAAYARAGNTLRYAVHSREPLARRVRWALPPSRVVEVLVDGHAVPYHLEPGVNCQWLCFETPTATDTAFQITVDPLPLKAEAPGSLAEGDSFTVRMTGARVTRVIDRCGVLSEASVENGLVRATIKTGLLDAYRGYGRLGQMTFSRRTFFLESDTPDGALCYVPVEIAVLPRFEVTSVSEVDPNDGGVRLRVRNNTSAPLQGEATLRTARQWFRFAVDVPARAERDIDVPIPPDAAALFSPGDNRAEVILPDGASLDLVLQASALFAGESARAQQARTRMVPVPLPETERQDDAGWREVRTWYAYGHFPWAGAKPPFESLAGQATLSVEGLPQVEFLLHDRKLVPISWHMHRPAFTLDLGGKSVKKAYLLVVPFLDNHDVYAPVARVSAQRTDGGIVSRTLYFPGDWDWWVPEPIVGEFATIRGPREDRFGLLPRLGPEQADWDAARPPEFPQPAWWASCRAARTDTSVLNVIELDLGGPMDLRSLTVETIGTDPALGLVVVTLETPGDVESLRGTPWYPPAAFREPRVVFELDSPDALKGWALEGTAFSVASVPALFDEATLNSLAAAGETATGSASSPSFEIRPEDTRLGFLHQGGHGSLRIELLDADSKAVLDTFPITCGSPALQWGGFEIVRWRGKRVQLRLVDENADTSYAWLGIPKVVLYSE